MSLHSKPFYWLECDTEGCDERSPHQDSEYAAWASIDMLSDMASEENWHLSSEHGHYCEQHWFYDEDDKIEVVDRD